MCYGNSKLNINNTIYIEFFMSFDIIDTFEETIAQFYGAPYAVAVDCCTHAIELCLRHIQPKATISVPKHTYISVPFTLEKLNLNWQFDDRKWEQFYTLSGTNIIDGAVHFKKNGYVTGSLMCLSFQYRKPLSLGRGGAILCETKEDYVALKKLSYDGRYGTQPWAEQDIDSMGYHYYMTPETAQAGLNKLPEVAAKEWAEWTWMDYPDLSTFKVFL